MATEYKLSYTAEEIDEKLSEIDNAVLYIGQELTDTQKEQARENIGAASVEQIASAIPTALKNPQPLTVNGQSYDGSEAVQLMLEPLIVTNEITGSDTNYNLSEMYAAHEANRPVYYEWDGYLLPTVSAGIDKWLFSGVVDDSNQLIAEAVRMSDGGTFVGRDNHPLARKTDIPIALPNPNALTINGTVYDGSEAVTVDVTDGSDGVSPTVAVSKSGKVTTISITDAEGTKTTTINDGEDLVNETLPDYWLEHLDSKIETIKSLQDSNGKDCFSFIVITDPHYTQNLGKRSPSLAKYIMDKCHIRHAMVLGDLQNRGSWSTKVQVEEEWKNIEEMFEPLHELRQKGNHDGSWGNTLNSVTYPYNFTVEEMFNRIYGKTYQHHDVVTDSSGTAYYVDDKSRKVRFILLNTHCNEYGLNSDGSAKYNNTKLFRFTQTQYDFLTEDALVTGLDNNWRVVVCAHVPINNVYASAFGGDSSSGDHINMRNLLKAYRDKTTCAISWDGTAGGVSTGGYTNLFDTTGEGYTAWDGSNMFTNWIPYSVNDNGGLGTIYHIKGWTKDGQPYKCHFAVSSNFDDTTALTACTSANQKALVVSDYDTSVKLYQHKAATYHTHIRFRFTEDIAANLIITANENIVEAVESDTGYDAVTVNADFSTAKGKLVGYFSGHAHNDYIYNATDWGIPIITTRCDGANENDSTLLAERIEGTTTEQSFDVFTVTPTTIYATKIGAGSDRTISY